MSEKAKKETTLTRFVTTPCFTFTMPQLCSLCSFSPSSSFPLFSSLILSIFYFFLTLDLKGRCSCGSDRKLERVFFSFVNRSNCKKKKAMLPKRDIESEIKRMQKCRLDREKKKERKRAEVKNKRQNDTNAKSTI